MDIEEVEMSDYQKKVSTRSVFSCKLDFLDNLLFL